MVLKENCLVPLLSMVLKGVALLTSCSMSWKETFFLPDLPMVLKEVTMPLFLTYHWLCWHYPFLWWSYAIYTNGLEKSWLVSVLLSPASCIFGWGLERSLSACTHSHGLERSGWMVLKGLRCNSLVPQWYFAIYFRQWFWKESLELVFVLFSIAETEFESFLHNTHMRPNLVLAACPMTISFGVLASTT